VVAVAGLAAVRRRTPGVAVMRLVEQSVMPLVEL